MGFTALSPWAVGQKLRAVTLNLINAAIADLQNVATAEYFDQSKAITCAVATASNVGTWTTSGNYLSSGSGIQLPNNVLGNDLFIVTLAANRTSGAWSTRAYLECTLGASTYRSSIDAGVGEDRAVLTFVTTSVGGVVTPRYYTGTAANVTFNLTIVRIPAI
jgi:hypothetical protein